MNCAEACRALDAHLEPGREHRAPLRTHLAGCAPCREYAARLAGLDARLTTHYGRLAPGPDFEARLRAHLARETPDPRVSVAEENARTVAARRALDRATLLDGLASLAGGATALCGAWWSAPSLAAWIERGTEGSGTFVLATATACAVAAAAWAALRCA